ncbi:DSD1 family PLP-dependent enzyme [soil metagenome]
MRRYGRGVNVHDLPTPALVVDVAALDHNIDAMSQRRPAGALRPHVKAFKSTALATYVAERGNHLHFCCATLREMEGMAAAGLGEDLLLANETLDGERLTRLVDSDLARITVAVDSEETVRIAAAAGAEILLDIDVGLPRCGCLPEEAGPLAALARSLGAEVRGVMGYEGHVMGNPDRDQRTLVVAESMELLRRAHDDVGGDVTSAGGTGTYDLHNWAREVQAGSYLLMDSHYGELRLPFRQALTVQVTVISRSPSKGWAVVDGGLKAFGMDHGNPSLALGDGTEGAVFFLSDEHTTILAGQDASGAPTLPEIGDRLRMVPAHIDPTVAMHERMHLVDTRDGSGGTEVLDSWPVDLRNW